MCGICGIVPGSVTASVAPDTIAGMVETLSHRGPDENGIFTNDRAALGHARLSIIDLASGRQPMSNEDDTVWITYNGELYNYQELRRELIGKGHKFRTNTDTETIVHLYEEEGLDCVDRLRGMFAFAIWDDTRRQLFLARDRLGIKPLYYAVTSSGLVFGSEIKAVLKSGRVPLDLDFTALLDFLTFGWIPAPKSIFKAINKLRPGHIAVYDSAGLQTSEYWDFGGEEFLPDNEEDLCAELRERIREAVQIRMVADVPLGAFLSGGLDSSSVVAMMAQLSDRPVVTNSVGFEEDAFDELHFADGVANRFGTDHHRHLVSSDAANMMRILAWHWDEPFADSSAVPTFHLSRKTREAVTVALSGDGGDENLAGYRRYKLSQRQRIARDRLPESLRRNVFGALGSVFPKADWLPRFLRAKSTLLELAEDDVHAICRSRALMQPEISRQLLKSEVRQAIGGYDPTSAIDYHYRRCPIDDSLGRELYTDIKTYLVDDILTKVDRASMAVSLEVRVPLLDHKLVEFMARIPASFKLRGGEGKYIMKQAFRPLLGTEVVDRKKMGFSIPLHQWLRGPLAGIVEDSVLGSDSRVAQWLDMDEVRKNWRLLQSGRSHRESLIWSLLMLEQWSRVILDQDWSFVHHSRVVV